MKNRVHRIAFVCLLIIVTAISNINAQTCTYTYFNNQDSSYYSSLIFLPEQDSIKGLIVRDYSSLPDTSRWKPSGFPKKCLYAGYAYLITTSSNYFPELCYNDTVLHRMDTMIYHALKAYPIRKSNVFVGGISASGTRAFKYAEFCNKGKSSFETTIAGVFGVDPPLDLVRFYNSVHASDSLKAGMAEEAVLMRKVFDEKMGDPKNNWIQFYETSVYTFQNFTGGNAEYYMDVPILLFHEPDLDWWWKERGARYKDINSIDIDRFASYLRDSGKKNIEVVKTSGKGFDRQGNRKCHSWTIVDEDYLVQWIINHSSSD